MNTNRLKMNCSKTEFSLFGNQAQIKKCRQNEIVVDGEKVEAGDSMKYLGVSLDKELNFKKFVSDKCRKCNFTLKCLRDIRRLLSVKTCHHLVNCLVTSQIDYANALLSNVPKCTLRPLQMTQNRAAKLVLLRDKYDSSTQARNELHWLPITERVQFKTLCIAHSCVYGNSPAYIQSMFKQKESTRYQLRTYDTLTYVVPNTKCKKFGDRAFSVAGPKQWNELPYRIREIEDFQKFKKELKTHLFSIAYP